MICNLCAKNCGAKRDENTADGFCGMTTKLKIAHYELFSYEEPCISFSKGSGAIFFSGCSLKCVFCQNYEISTLNKGKEITVLQLVDIFKELENAGADHFHLVSPTHYALQIAQALEIYRPHIPIIYNCHGYESLKTIEFMSKYIDVFLPDFKYYDNVIAQKFSKVGDYFEKTFAAIKKMRELKTDVFSPDGKILSGVIIRHLILPLCTDDSIKVLQTIKQNIPNTKVSLMSQYVPCGEAENISQINRKITKREYNKVLNAFINLGLDGYVQELESASKDFIPKFRFVN